MIIALTLAACGPIDIGDGVEDECGACSDSGEIVEPTDSGEADSDTDADADSDTDSDTDTDTDTSAPADVDGDGYSAEPDCDDSDASVNPDASEVCDSVDNDCDGAIDEGDVCEEEDGIYDITIMVTSSNLDHLDFSYGYCSDKDDPADCSAWNQSVVSATGSSVTWSGVVYATGSMRANSSFFVGSDSTADHWLCEGYSSPTLTAAVQVWIDGESMGDGGVWGVPYSSGCSAGFDITALITEYKK